MYPTLEGARYDPVIHLPRNAEELKRDCEMAEGISSKLVIGRRQPLQPWEKDLLKKLQAQNVHAHRNPFHYAPMGANNDIYQANPPDTLHLFCAGLLKALLGWTLSIVDSVSDVHQVSLFDRRIHNFPYVTAMPHVNWQYFTGGIMKFNRKSKAEKLQATGSFGGFRSSSFISMLLQTFYAIGTNDDVLKSDIVTKSAKNIMSRKLYNVRGKVLKAIECLLDVYFDCRRKEWSPLMLTDFQSKISRLPVHLLLVWDLKQTIINPNETKITVNKMRNLHKLEHLPMYISRWGSLNHLDTGTFESYHKIGTTKVWETTSKRHNTLFEEMTQKVMMHDYQRINKIKSDIISGKMQEKAPVEKVTFRRILNLPKYVLFVPYRYSGQIYVGVPGEDEGINDQQWSKVCSHRALNTSHKLKSFLEKYKVHEVIQAHYQIQCDMSFNQCYEMHIIQGISYSSDEESQMGTGTIYACSRHNIKDRRSDPDKPRYDYVFIKYEYIPDPVLVRILLFIEITRIQRTSTDEHDEIIVVLVQKLIKVPNKTECVLGDTYQFAGDPESKSHFYFDIVPVQSIIRPAFVVPIFNEEEYNTLWHRGSDRFRVLDRMFFDRSGWQSGNVDRLSDGLETAIQRESYIAKHLTSNRFLKDTIVEAHGTKDNHWEEEEEEGDDADSSSDESVC